MFSLQSRAFFCLFQIRGEFFHLLSSLVDVVVLNESLLGDQAALAFRATLTGKLVPLVFYACDEEHQVCSFYVWQAIAKLATASTSTSTTNLTNLWSLLNVKKAFVPKLLAVLRSHATGGQANTSASSNGEHILPSLCLLVSKLRVVFDEAGVDELAAFYKELLARLYEMARKDALASVNNSGASSSSSKITRFNPNSSASSRDYVTRAFFDCLTLALESGRTELGCFLLSNHVREKELRFHFAIINSHL